MWNQNSSIKFKTILMKKLIAIVGIVIAMVTTAQTKAQPADPENVLAILLNLDSEEVKLYED